MRRPSRSAVSIVVLLFASSGATADIADEAKGILNDAGVKGGLVIHIGCGDGRLTTALHMNDRIVVHGLDADITEARETIRTAGVYGPVSVHPWSGGTLPYADNLARLVVVSGEGQLDQAEVLRVLCPGGTAVMAGKKIVKPWPASMDDWPQHFHGADNNAVSTDTMVGPPRRTQWIASPQWSRAHLVLPSIHSMVSANGRLITIEDQASAEHPALPGKFAMVCRDAFSGIVLWQNRFPDWQPVNVYIKFTPAQLQRQLVVIGDTIYATPGLDAPITAFDAATGRKIRDYPGTERVQEFAYDRGVFYTVIGDPFDTDGIGANPGGTIGASAFPARTYGPRIPKLEDPKSEIRAVDAESGETVWSVSGEKTRGYEGTSLAVRGEVAVYCTGKELICLDRQTGVERWHVPVAINYKGRNAKFTGRPGYTVALVLSDDTVYLAAGNALSAHRISDGAEQWSGSTHLNHFKAPDLFLAAGAVWTANRVGYDPATGDPIRNLPQKMTGPMGHDRCYRNRITERWYINTASGGSDFLALDGSRESPNPWVRSTCGVGHLPCNGLLYAGPPACGCCNMVQLNAFNALAPDPSLETSGKPVPVNVQPDLEKGPAYAAREDLEFELSNTDWPAYRHDAGRSGCTTAVVSARLKPVWSTRLSTSPSAPVIAGGMVFVADVDAHAVCALDAADGRERWRFVTEARVDSPPTLHRGIVLFGSRDGRVYAVRATDGALVWRFKALPDRLICAYEQMESVWPVSGSILIQNNIAYFAAGRNSFLDGGVFLFGLDPLTGRLLHRRRLAGPYDETGFPKIPGRAITGGMGLEGHKGDILLADEHLIYLRHQAFEKDLTPVDADRLTSPHLITSHGFTQAVPHHRSFWTLDTTLRYDIPTGSGPVHGDILVRDGSRFYEVRGYKPGRTGPFDPRIEGYRLFAGEISPIKGQTRDSRNTVENGKRKRAGQTAQKKRKGSMRRVFTSRERWTVPIPLTGKALAKAGNVIFVAGTPVEFPAGDLAKAYEGRMGGLLWAISAVDGRKLSALHLDAPPVWDSLATANGHVFLCTTDGRVHCFAGEAAE